MALIDLGSSDEELVAALQQAYQRHPEVESFSYFLSSLLSASPLDSLRDGERALVLAKTLYRDYPSPEHGELLAMAYAELGGYERAREFQGWAVERARGEGGWYLLPRLVANMERFEADQPCRSPWSGGPLLLQVKPASFSKPFRDYPTEASY